MKNGSFLSSRHRTQCGRSIFSKTISLQLSAFSAQLSGADIQLSGSPGLFSSLLTADG